MIDPNNIWFSSPATTYLSLNARLFIFHSLCNMSQGGSKITLAKGNRSPVVSQACKDNGGFYLGMH